VSRRLLAVGGVGLGMALLVGAILYGSFLAQAFPHRASAPSSHACADKVARATVEGSVSGLWNCLDTDFQNTLHTYARDGDGALFYRPVAASWRYIGESGDVVYYQLVLTPEAVVGVGWPNIGLAVFLDNPSRQVADWGFGLPTYRGFP
jgi:hypothetical protein